jgi:two-component system, OmpR family, sensor histidine kinase CpxA
VSRIRVPLYVQLLAWFSVNLVLIAVLVYVFAAPNQTGWNLLLTQSVRDRLEAIARGVAEDLYGTPQSSWGAVLARHRASFDGVEFSAQAHGGPPGPPDGGDRGGGPPRGDGGPPGAGAEPRSGDGAGLRGGPGSGDGPGMSEGPGPGAGFGAGPNAQGRLGPPDAPPPFIDIRRSRVSSGYDVAIGVLVGRGGGPPSDLRITAHVGGTFELLQLLGIGHEIAFLAAILLMSALLWWPFVWGMTRTIRQLLLATQQMSQGRLEVRVSESRRDELGELASAVNAMAERLQTYLQGQRQFIADVAHEVISPVARMQIGLGILETQVPEHGAGTLIDVRDDLEQMAQMLDELLLFSRSGMEADRTSLEPTGLRKLVEKVVATDAAGASVSVNVPSQIDVRAQPAMLGRALSNLVRNAQRYAGEGVEPIEIVASRAGDRVRLCVRDRGPGVPESALARLGEPFFRPELSRSRASGGFGLGLAIVRRCVATCGGQVQFRNRAGGGFEAELTLNADP